MRSTDLGVLKVVAGACSWLLLVSPPSSAVSRSAAATHSSPQLLHFLVVHDGLSFPQIQRPRQKRARPGFEREVGVTCKHAGEGRGLGWGGHILDVKILYELTFSLTIQHTVLNVGLRMF